MFCPQCGKQVADGAMFCAYCGTSMSPGGVQQPSSEASGAQVPVYDPSQQPGPYFAPPSQYSAAAPHVEPAVPRNKFSLVWSILLTVLCCNLVFGILSIVFTTMADSAAQRGDTRDAEQKYKTARILFWVGLGIELAIVITYAVLLAIGVTYWGELGNWQWEYYFR